MRAEPFYTIPKPDITLLNAGTLNPMDREQRYAPAKPRTGTDKEPENDK